MEIKVTIDDNGIFSINVIANHLHDEDGGAVIGFVSIEDLVEDAIKNILEDLVARRGLTAPNTYVLYNIFSEAALKLKKLHEFCEMICNYYNPNNGNDFGHIDHEKEIADIEEGRKYGNATYEQFLKYCNGG